MTMTTLLVIAALAAQVAVARPHLEEPHGKVLPKEIGFVMLGTYVLDKPVSTGATEMSFTIVDGKHRLRIGEEESLLVFEGTALEESAGLTTDVYKFTVVGKPGVQMSFKVTRGRGRVDYLTYFEEFAKPEVFATGKPKRR
jgi:hypothetical protein